MAITLRGGGVEIVCDTPRELAAAKKLFPGLKRKKPAKEKLAAGQRKHWLFSAWWGTINSIPVMEARSRLTAMRSKDAATFAALEERYAVFLRRYAKREGIKETDQARIQLRSLYKRDHEAFAELVAKIESMHGKR